MNKIFMYHLVLIGFFSNVRAMDRVKSLVGLNTYPCVFTGETAKKGTIAFRAREKSAVHKNINQISYDMQTDQATLQFKDESVLLEGSSLDGLMDCLSKLSHYSDVSVRTTIGNTSQNWGFSRGQDARNAAALYSMNKCRQSLRSVSGAPSDGKIQDVNVVKSPKAGTGTLSCTSSPYLPGSCLRLTNDKNDKQSILIHRDLVPLLYNAYKAVAMYNKEKESSAAAKQVLVKALFPSSLVSGVLREPNPEEEATLQLLEKDLPVMEQWLYAQKVKKYVMSVSFVALLAAIGAYFYSTSNAQ